MAAPSLSAALNWSSSSARPTKYLSRSSLSRSARRGEPDVAMDAPRASAKVGPGARGSGFDEVQCALDEVQNVLVVRADVVVEAVQVGHHARRARMIGRQCLPESCDGMVVQALPIGLRGARAEVL